MRKILTPLSVSLLIVGLFIHAFYLYSLQPSSEFAKFFHDSTVVKEAGCDFFALYKESKNLLHDTDGKVYTLDLPCIFGYRYLPIGILVGLPFAQFQPEKARFLWTVFLVILSFVNVMLLFRIAQSPTVFGAGALLFLGASPVFLELYMGQYSLLQGTLLFASLTALHLNKTSAFNGAFAATLCWKMNTWIAVPALLRKGLFRPILIALVLILVTSLPYFFLHPASWDAFVMNFTIKGGDGLTKGNHGLFMLFLQAFPLVNTGKILLGIATAVILASLAITVFAKRAHEIDLIVLWMSAYFLVYKHVWEHHYVMLLPLIVILAVRHRSAFLWIPGLIVALPTFFYMAVQADWSAYWPMLYHGTKPLSAALVYLFCVKKCFRE